MAIITTTTWHSTDVYWVDGVSGHDTSTEVLLYRCSLLGTAWERLREHRHMQLTNSLRVHVSFTRFDSFCPSIGRQMIEVAMAVVAESHSPGQHGLHRHLLARLAVTCLHESAREVKF